jgi:hypothetical protein
VCSLSTMSDKTSLSVSRCPRHDCFWRAQLYLKLNMMTYDPIRDYRRAFVCYLVLISHVLEELLHRPSLKSELPDSNLTFEGTYVTK